MFLHFFVSICSPQDSGQICKATLTELHLQGLLKSGKYQNSILKKKGTRCEHIQWPNSDKERHLAHYTMSSKSCLGRAKKHCHGNPLPPPPHPPKKGRLFFFVLGLVFWGGMGAGREGAFLPLSLQHFVVLEQPELEVLYLCLKSKSFFCG